jgi:hypothetical protein
VIVVTDRLVSVIVPSRCEAGSIGRIVSAVREQKVPGGTVEVIVAESHIGRSAAA